MSVVQMRPVLRNLIDFPASTFLLRCYLEKGSNLILAKLWTPFSFAITSITCLICLSGHMMVPSHTMHASVSSSSTARLIGPNRF